MRFVEPVRGNAAALGLNVLSIPAARTAIERSRAEGTSIASAPFALELRYAPKAPAAPLADLVYVRRRLRKALGRSVEAHLRALADL